MAAAKPGPFALGRDAAGVQASGGLIGRLTDGAVLLWHGRVQDVPVQARIDTLSPAEIARASRYRHERDHDRFVAGRAALRAILAQVTNEPPRALVISDGGRKPRLPDFPHVFFSVSRSSDILSIAVAGTPVGIDVEEFSEAFQFEPVVDSLFHAREKAAIRDLTGHPRTTAFYRIWTQKEALAKALGSGLSLDLVRFAAPLEGGRIFIESGPHSSECWFSAIPDIDHTCLLAIVTGVEAPKIEIMRLA